MENIEESEYAPPTQENIGIFINGIKYNYSIVKSEEKKDSLIIKLYEPNFKSKYYFSYEASYDKIIKDINFFSIFQNIDEIIDSLNEFFSKRNIDVKENNGIYYLQLKIIGVKKNSLIQLTKKEIEVTKEPKNEFEKEIYNLEIKFKDLLNKFEQIKITKENEIKNKIKQVIFDKDIKIKLFEEMEQLFLSKYNLNKLNNIPENNRENEKQLTNIGNNILNKVQNFVDNKEIKINNQIVNIQKQLKDNLDYLNKIKLNNNNDNYIILQIKVDNGNDNGFLNQVPTYKFFKNFERDDIEAIIDGKVVPIGWCSDEYSKKNLSNLSANFSYGLRNLHTPGIYTIKIIFKKKLLKCNKLFAGYTNIYNIDCSHFDCSQIIDCSSMFEGCSNVTEINLGKLDFALSQDFSSMFKNCSKLEKLDVSNLNTENSLSFSDMFNDVLN